MNSRLEGTLPICSEEEKAKRTSVLSDKIQWNIVNRKWLMACVCVAAEMFLIWTTYGLGYSVLVIILFALIEIVGMVIGKKKKV